MLNIAAVHCAKQIFMCVDMWQRSEEQRWRFSNNENMPKIIRHDGFN
jgi:hypothetical protein